MLAVFRAFLPQSRIHLFDVIIFGGSRQLKLEDDRRCGEVVSLLRPSTSPGSTTLFVEELLLPPTGGSHATKCRKTKRSMVDVVVAVVVVVGSSSHALTVAHGS